MTEIEAALELLKIVRAADNVTAAETTNKEKLFDLFRECLAVVRGQAR